MSKFFIHRPIFAIVISLIIVIVGIIAAVQLPIAQYPQISPPTVSVGTSYTGANAAVVNETVAQIIEQQVNGTQGMSYMSSNSDDTGRYGLSVTFEVGTDGDMDSVKVQNNVAAANANLPNDVKTVGVTTRKASSDMAYMLAIFSPDGTYDRAFMKNYADIYLLDQIKRVPGVGDVQIFGSNYAMRVWLNPDKLAELGLTIADVSAAIQEQNVQAPAGTVGAMPASNGQEKQYTGKIAGRLVTPEEFGNIILRADGSGQFVRLKDVARIETGQQASNIIAKFDGYPSVAFGINLTSDANAKKTVAGVKKILEEARPNLPPGLKMAQIFDSTNYINASIREVTETFIEALLLVVLVIFIFLQNWRATLIPLLAVPVSLIGTFGAFIVLNFSINTLTLFAMVLAIGLVVDDAIVVIENVEHHMGEGLSPMDATERAMHEVQGPVVAIACVLAAVFVPVAFLGGMMGVLYKQFALTIAISMALSAFVALTLTPALCAMLLRPHGKEEKEGILGRFFSWFNRVFDMTRRGYMGVVARFVRHARLAVVFLLIVCGLTGLVYTKLPSTFVPEEDQGYLFTAVNLPEGTSANQTQKTMDKLASAAKEQDGVDHVMSITGFDILSSGAKPSGGLVVLGMKDWSQREDQSVSVASTVRKMFGIGAKLAPEAFTMAVNPPALPGLGAVGGWTMQLQDMTGHSDTELNDIVQKIIAEANQRPELQGVRTTFSINSPTYEYEIDREKVKNLGVKLTDVFTAMQVNFGGAQVNDFNQFGRTYKVMLQSDLRYRNEAEAAKFVFVRSASGTMVPLDTLLRPKLSTGPTQISRFNGTRAVQIQGNARQGYSSGQAMGAIEEIVRANAPSGFNIEWSGQSREEKKASSSTGRVLALALIFVFLALAALYESWSVPFAVLLTVPTGIFGALVSEYGLSILEAVTGHPNPGLQNSVYMQIGVIMIIGLAAKNAILIVEFAKVRVDRGMEPVKAAIEAAGLRLRPILMTSFAFIIGCLPLAVASGAGAAARNGMGVAVVGGMLFATSLGIFLIPVFFVAIEWIASKLGLMKQSRKKTSADYM
ncbi:efflux RND transporter permease subunit [Mitsuokella sp. oral taxon 131]|uniref:efflux RND transporter permease subunit n=1 Tax=Mitsuokella sp. oral taxon 131 TaxID=1321780 RepID=UPI0003AE0CE9|nr:multidrug efflux RND transporter permease subunit [Mitsuokella sp. oral taxon 131]ERL04580.1 putative acriflavine resistance protein B [Mitsuokella sp. oral taxon 131 str. W9106]